MIFEEFFVWFPETLMVLLTFQTWFFLLSHYSMTGRYYAFPELDIWPTDRNCSDRTSRVSQACGNGPKNTTGMRRVCMHTGDFSVGHSALWETGAIRIVWVLWLLIGKINTFPMGRETFIRNLPKGLTYRINDSHMSQLLLEKNNNMRLSVEALHCQVNATHSKGALYSPCCYFPDPLSFRESYSDSLRSLCWSRQAWQPIIGNGECMGNDGFFPGLLRSICNSWVTFSISIFRSNTFESYRIHLFLPSSSAAEFPQNVTEVGGV